jgi:hypothetical protein
MDYDLAHQLWLDTDLKQDEIAERVGATPATFSRYVKATYTQAERDERQARIRSMSQSVTRVPTPSWYTGKGKSVPLKVIEYCQLHGITCLPPDTSVVLLDGGSMTLMSTKEAKKWRANESKRAIQSDAT